MPLHKYLSVLILVLFLPGCMSLQKNPPLEQLNSPEAYNFTNIYNQEGGTGDNIVVLSLSGGGTRAGALAYGVMKAMDQVKLPDGQTLMDEVNVISSVSGGSFAAAYYGLHGKEKFFQEYKNEVLERKLSSRLVLSLIRFGHWIPIMFSPNLGRSDVAQRLYDKQFYDGKTFADMPRKWPFIIINSTDMAQGTTFSFIQEQFNLLCSDVNDVKIARAVTASSAFPGPFTPLTFKNYPKSTCGYEFPSWVDQALSAPPEKDLEQFTWAQNLISYKDPEVRNWIHVFDGGVADNLGMRSVLDNFRMGNWQVLLDEDHRIKAKKVIVVIVDAKPPNKYSSSNKPKIPKLMSVMMNAATLPMRNYSVKTVQEFALRVGENRTATRNFKVFKHLCDQVHSGEGAREACYQEFEGPFGGRFKPPFPDNYLIHIQFDSIKDPALLEEISGIGTSLQLKKSQIDLLEDMGGKLLRESPSFHKLVKDLGAQTAQPLKD